MSATKGTTSAIRAASSVDSPSFYFLNTVEVRAPGRAGAIVTLGTSGAYDAVIDFDRVLRDPAQPTRLRPEYDSGDHVHPNDLGHRALADAIDLRLFRAED